jgi:predicted DNA-binding protein
MRTTIEIPDEQHEALLAVARRRGLRGFSQLVKEALDAYLTDLSAGEVDAILALEGILDEGEEEELRRRITQAKTTWRAS